MVDEARPPHKSALFNDRLEVIGTNRGCVSPAGEAVWQSFTSSWIRSLKAFFAFDADQVLDLLVARVLLLGGDHVATAVELRVPSISSFSSSSPSVWRGWR